LGHHSISLTFDKYGHLYETDTQRLADALDAAYSTGLVVPETPQTIPVAGGTRVNPQSQDSDHPTEPATTQAVKGL
jgi:hypothetical protein